MGRPWADLVLSWAVLGCSLAPFCGYRAKFENQQKTNSFCCFFSSLGPSAEGSCGGLGASWTVLGRLGTVLERLGAVLERLGVILGRLGTILKRPGTSWGVLGSSWSRFVAILEPSWGHLGATLGRPWVVLGLFWAVLGVLKLLLVAIDRTSKIIEKPIVFGGVSGWGPYGNGLCGGLGASWTVLRRLESALRADEKL